MPAPQQLKDEALFRTACLVGGDWIEADDGSTISVDDPATGDEIATVPSLGPVEVRRAIEVAAVAQRDWRRVTARERARVLHRWADLLTEHRDDVGLIMGTEHGKPWEEAKGEVDYAASFLEWFAEEAGRANGDVVPTFRSDSRVIVLREPVGVAAGITPWNFPAAMIGRKVGPALAVGCAMVVKPASQTPLTALALAELGRRAGVPDGVFNVVTGKAGPIGEELTSNPSVRKLSFTGSTEVGRTLMAQCAHHIMKVSLELGGNAPFIVFDDADLDAAVEGTLVAKFRNSGQTCIAANRILVHERVVDDYVDRLTKAVSGLEVGATTDPGAKIGPLIDDAAVDKVARHVEDAVGHGAEVVLGGSANERGGRFWDPTVLVGVKADTAMSCEETFGPVAGIDTFRDDEQAVRQANETPYGLASYVYSRDIGRLWRAVEGLEYGMVGANTGFISSPVAPFGGVKESGLGREGSVHGIDEYTELKYVCLGGLDR
ncbi:MAG: NAD-dependent succinate-semialdehyde dehydrogenase [Actinobacteria bacterium]|nr:NAD-dependent succinate-semialdehyde dehydrogenase [Actinomycetota bacterium]